MCPVKEHKAYCYVDYVGLNIQFSDEVLHPEEKIAFKMYLKCQTHASKYPSGLFQIIASLEERREQSVHFKFLY